MKLFQRFSLLLLLLICQSFIAQEQEDIFEKLDEIAIIDQKVMMPMRDGIRLASVHRNR